MYTFEKFEFETCEDALRRLRDELEVRFIDMLLELTSLTEFQLQQYAISAANRGRDFDADLFNKAAYEEGSRRARIFVKA